jgi:hypothetical protein
MDYRNINDNKEVELWVFVDKIKETVTVSVDTVTNAVESKFKGETNMDTFKEETNMDTKNDNYESLKNELGLEHMPTVSQDSYTISEDTNGDGQVDYVYDRYDPAIPYHISEDTNGDGKVDSIYNRYDTDGDGYYETVVDAVDYNKDGNFDFAYKSYDTNGDGHHDSVVEVYDQNSNGYTDQKLVLNDNNHDGYFESEVAINDDGFYNA